METTSVYFPFQFLVCRKEHKHCQALIWSPSGVFFNRFFGCLLPPVCSCSGSKSRSAGETKALISGYLPILLSASSSQSGSRPNRVFRQECLRLRRWRRCGQAPFAHLTVEVTGAHPVETATPGGLQRYAAGQLPIID